MPKEQKKSWTTRIWGKTADKPGNMGLKAIGVLVVFVMIMALIGFLGVSALSIAILSTPVLGELLGIPLIMTAIIGILVAIFFISFGVGLFKEKQRAFWLLYAITFIWIIWNILALFSGIGYLAVNLFWLIISLLLLYYLIRKSQLVDKNSCKKYPRACGIRDKNGRSFK